MATEQQLNVKLPPPPIDPKKRIMSKDINTPNPSFRVYYGGASVAVPFTWETAPGTPKHHNSSDNNTLQIPLSPPPSFYAAASINSAAASRGGGGSSAKRLLLPNYLVKALSGLRSSSSSISSYSSARSYSLSFSSASTATTSFSPGSLSRRRRRSRCFSCSRLPVVHHGDVNSNDGGGDDDEEVFEERKSNCDEEGRKRKNVGKRRSLSIGGGWDSIGRMSNVLFGCGGGGRS
ncbi:hypothetical protein LINPERPRIM_LOCUS23542 [Linum perenne]